MTVIEQRQRLVRDLYARAALYEAAAVRAADCGERVQCGEFRWQAESCQRDADLLVLTIRSGCEDEATR